MKEEMTDKYDLHVHSQCSDGTDSPFTLLDKIKEIGFQGISITDHDTIDAYTEELFEYAKKLEVDLLPGVEFSSHYDGNGVHILGYFFDRKNQALIDFCKEHHVRRRKRNEIILKLLERHGMKISIEELYMGQDKSIGRPHIAKILVDKGYAESIGDVFQRWIGDGKPCFERGIVFSIQKTIEVIRKAKGKAVLAHPILLKRHSLIRQVLKEAPFDGIEAYYARFSEKQNQEMVKIGEKGRFIMTGGSDYHGENKPLNKLGSAYTTPEVVGRLRGDE
jgi:predicted metal-dependent phosphoesterase TrpH